MDIQHIMVAVDLSAQAKRAVEGVAQWLKAVGGGVKVTLLHIDETPALGAHNAEEVVALMTRIAHARAERMGNLARWVHEAGGEVAVEVGAGVPHEEIVKRAKDLGVDMVVLAKRGDGEGPLLGSTSRRVLERLPCAVWVLPPVRGEAAEAADAQATPEAPAAQGFRKLLVTTDMGEDSARGLEIAARLSARMGARLVAVHALRVPMMVPILPGEVPLQLPQDSVEHMQMLEGGALQAWVEGVVKGTPIRSRLAVGASVSRAILDTASDESADLLIVPSQGKGRLARFLLGSVALSIAEQAHVGVLVLPPARPESP